MSARRAPSVPSPAPPNPVVGFETLGAAMQHAQHQVRYAHQEWIAWPTRAGGGAAARMSAATIKAAMLDTGPSDWLGDAAPRIRLYGAGDRHAMLLTWWIANNIRRQYLAGHRT